MSVEEITPEIPFLGPICVLDTETGGFSSKKNPLLSIGLAIGDDKGIHDKREFKFAPPVGTVLEIPVHEDQCKAVKSKRIEHWLVLATGELIAPQSIQANYVINAQAAEINGFVGVSDTITGWDMQPMQEWLDKGFSYEAGQEVIITWLKHQPACAAAMAHNAKFDRDFVKAWLPLVHAELPAQWVCTMQHFKLYHQNSGGVKLSAGLDALCKFANYNPSDAGDLRRHSSLGDCLAVYAAWRHMRVLG